MVEGKATLVVDLGNSESRVLTICGKTKKGNPRQRLTVLPNKFGELSSKSLVDNPDYTEQDSKVFSIGNSSFCSGRMCDVEKGTASLRPSASIKKYDSMITMYTLRLAFLQGFYDVADMVKTSPDAVSVSWDVVVLLPPSDLELGADKLRNNVLSLTSIDFDMPKFKKDIIIDSVKVFPEGFCAFIGASFVTSREIRAGFRDVVMNSTLIIDIGAGTSDYSIVKEAHLVDGSRYSEETGGNQVFQKVNNELRRKLGRNFPEDTLREATVTGVLKIGAKEIDIIDIIAIAKKDVATKLSASLKNYIESSDFSIYDIQNILICGGGADDCAGSGMKPLGDYLKEELKVWMEYSDFLDIPEQTVTYEDNGEDKQTTEKISPRLLNIIGAGILSEA